MDFSLDLPSVIVPVVGSLALFSYLAVEKWSDNRRKEREAFYRCDTLRKIADVQGGAPALEHALQYLREEERNAQTRRQEGLKLGGLVSMATGIGVVVSLGAILPDRSVSYLGVIPMLVGLALLLYTYILSPRS